MEEKEAKKILERLLSDNILVGNERTAVDLAIKALEAQNKLKEWIEAYNQPEFKDIIWNTEEVIGLLKEFVTE